MMQSFPPPPPAGSSRAARVLSSGNIRVPALVRITHKHKHSTSPGSNCKTIICSPAAAGSAVAGLAVAGPAVTGPQLLVHLAAGVGIGVVGMI